MKRLRRPVTGILFFVLALFSTVEASAVEIPLEKHGDVYSLPVRINGVIILHFILDSGASEVVIPVDVVMTLVRAGTIRESDFLPGKTYSMADSSELKSPRFIIRELELGGIRIINVPASVAPPAGDLLLGQSLLERLDSWALDNKRHALIVGSLPPKQDSSTPTLTPSPKPLTGLSPSDEESIKRLTTKYYDSVQKKDIEGAMNCYATEKRPQIKRSRIEAVAKDTEYYKIESMSIHSTETDKSNCVTVLTHKKHDSPPESWEITLEMIKEKGEWKIWATPGKKISTQSTVVAKKSTNSHSFGSFRFIVDKKEKDGTKSYDFHLYESNRSIYSNESYFTEPTINTLNDIPYSHCQSATTFIYSGGAHCCTTAILITKCEQQGQAYSVELAHTDSEQFKPVDLNRDGIHQMSLIDWAFAYYNVNNLRLSFASSPGFSRLLVFGNGQWSPDPPGKFTQYYMRLLQEAEGDLRKVRQSLSDEDRVSLAITKTYYAIMSGYSDAEAEAILNRELPYAWQPERRRIFADVKKAVFSFDPVKNLE
jgi:hypothetical protein